MKVKKRYIVACILMCLVAVGLCIAVFNLEVGLARFTKLNKTARTTWIETSARDPETGVNTDLFITKVVTGEEADEVRTFSYLGKQTVVDGKYVAYGKEVFGSGIVINDEVKMGDRVSVFYKPDDPLNVYSPVSCVLYIVFIAVCVVVGAALIFVCRIINNHMKDNTFSDAKVTFMDIPMAVIVAGLILSFFAGMLIGNLQIDSSYTHINAVLAEGYANHEYQF